MIGKRGGLLRVAVQRLLPFDPNLASGNSQ
jgi:hypothetical protein